MAELMFGTPGSGELSKILSAEDIQPGDVVGYETAKRLYEYHPLGGKLAEKPVAMALSQDRNIVIDGAPGDDVIEEFERARKELQLDEQCYRVAVIAKIYGIAAMFIGIKDADPLEPLKPDDLRDPSLFVNAVDPLNAAGSLVLNQNPLDPDYLKPRELAVSGVRFHRSRSVVLMNEMPIYLGWTDSAFGFSGRSVFQRILFSMKSYIEAMLAADMVARKCGVIVAETTQPSSAANQIASMFLGQKRREVKMARTGNVLSTGKDEKVYALDLTNVNASLEMAMRQIRETIAAGSGTPSILVNEETFAEGFGEGTEDAKHVAAFVEAIRDWVRPLFDFTDRIAQERAWTPEFYQLIQQRYPEYKDKPYEATVAEWRRQFKAEWPSYIKESETESTARVKQQLDALVGTFGAVFPLVDPSNKSRLIDWLCDCLNSMPDIVPSQLLLDPLSLEEFLESGGDQPEPIEDNVASFRDAIMKIRSGK